MTSNVLGERILVEAVRIQRGENTGCENTEERDSQSLYLNVINTVSVPSSSM